IDGHRNHLAAICLEQERRPAVAWRLHDHRRLDAYHQVRSQVYALLEASYDDDVVGRNRHSPGGTEIVCNELPKFRYAGGIVVLGDAFGRAAKALQQKTAPCLVGKRMRVGTSEAEVDADLRIGRSVQTGRAAPCIW